MPLELFLNSFKSNIADILLSINAGKRKNTLNELYNYCVNVTENSFSNEKDFSQSVLKIKKNIFDNLLEPLINFWSQFEYDDSKNIEFYHYCVFLADTIIILAHRFHCIVEGKTVKHVPLIDLDVLTGLALLLSEKLNREDWNIKIAKYAEDTGCSINDGCELFNSFKGIVALCRALQLTSATVYGTGMLKIKYASKIGKSISFNENVLSAIIGVNQQLCAKTAFSYQRLGTPRKSPKHAAKNKGSLASSDQLHYEPFYLAEEESPDSFFYEILSFNEFFLQFISKIVAEDKADASGADAHLYGVLNNAVRTASFSEKKASSTAISTDENHLKSCSIETKNVKENSEENFYALEKDRKVSELKISLCCYIIQRYFYDYLYIINRDITTAFDTQHTANKILMPLSVSCNDKVVFSLLNKTVELQHVVLPIVSGGIGCSRPVSCTSESTVWFGVHPHSVELTSLLFQIVEGTLRVVNTRRMAVEEESEAAAEIYIPDPDEEQLNEKENEPVEVENEALRNKELPTCSVSFMLHGILLSSLAIAFTAVACIHDAAIAAPAGYGVAISSTIVHTYAKASHLFSEKFLRVNDFSKVEASKAVSNVNSIQAEKYLSDVFSTLIDALLVEFPEEKHETANVQEIIKQIPKALEQILNSDMSFLTHRILMIFPHFIWFASIIATLDRLCLCRLCDAVNANEETGRETQLTRTIDISQWVSIKLINYVAATLLFPVISAYEGSSHKGNELQTGAQPDFDFSTLVAEMGEHVPRDVKEHASTDPLLAPLIIDNSAHALTFKDCKKIFVPGGRKKKPQPASVVWNVYLLHFPAVAASLAALVINSDVNSQDETFCNSVSIVDNILNPSIRRYTDSVLVSIFFEERNRIFVAQHQTYEREYYVNSVVGSLSIDSLVDAIVRSLKDVRVRDSRFFVELQGSENDEKSGRVDAEGVEMELQDEMDIDVGADPAELAARIQAENEEAARRKRPYRPSEAELAQRARLLATIERDLAVAGKPIDMRAITQLHYESLQLIQKRSAYRLQQESASSLEDATSSPARALLAYITTSREDVLADTQKKLDAALSRSNIYYATALSTLSTATDLVSQDDGYSCARGAAAEILAGGHRELEIRNAHALIARSILEAPPSVADACRDALCAALINEIENWRSLLRVELSTAPDTAGAIAAEARLYKTTLSFDNLRGATSLVMQCLFTAAAQSAIMRQLGASFGSGRSMLGKRVLRTIDSGVSEIDVIKPLNWIYGTEQNSGTRRKQPRLEEGNSRAAVEDVLHASDVSTLFFEADSLKNANSYSHLSSRIFSLLLHQPVSSQSTRQRFSVPFRLIQSYFLNVPLMTNNLWACLHRDICLSKNERRSRDGMALLGRICLERPSYTLHGFSSLLYFSSTENQTAREEAIKQLGYLLNLAYTARDGPANRLAPQSAATSEEYEQKVLETALRQADMLISEVRNIKADALRRTGAGYAEFCAAIAEGREPDQSRCLRESELWYFLPLGFIQDLSILARSQKEAVEKVLRSSASPHHQSEADAADMDGITGATQGLYAPQLCELLRGAQLFIRRWSQGTDFAGALTDDSALIPAIAGCYAQFLVKRRLSLLLSLLHFAPRQAPTILQKLLEIYSAFTELVDARNIVFDEPLQPALEVSEGGIITRAVVANIQQQIVATSFSQYILQNNTINEYVKMLFASLEFKQESVSLFFPLSKRENNDKTEIEEKEPTPSGHSFRANFSVAVFARQQFFVSTVMPQMRNCDAGAADFIAKIFTVLADAVRMLVVEFNKWYARTFVSCSAVSYSHGEGVPEGDNTELPPAEQLNSLFLVNSKVTQLRHASLSSFFQIIQLLQQHCFYIFNRRSTLRIVADAGIACSEDEQTQRLLGREYLPIPGDVRMLYPIAAVLSCADVKEVLLPALVRMHRACEYQFEYHSLYLSEKPNSWGAGPAPFPVATGRLLQLADPALAVQLVLGASSVLATHEKNTTSSTGSGSFEPLLASRLTGRTLPTAVVPNSFLSIVCAQPSTVEIILQALLHNIVNKCELPGLDYNLPLSASASSCLGKEEAEALCRSEKELLLRLGLAASHRGLASDAVSPEAEIPTVTTIKKTHLQRGMLPAELLREVLLVLDQLKRRHTWETYNPISLRQSIETTAKVQNYHTTGNTATATADFILFGDEANIGGSLPVASGLEMMQSASNTANVTKHSHLLSSAYSLLANKAGSGFLRMLLTRTMSMRAPASSVPESKKTILLQPLSIFSPGIFSYVPGESSFSAENMAYLPVVRGDVAAAPSAMQRVLVPVVHPHVPILPCWSWILLTWGSTSFCDACMKLGIDDGNIAAIAEHDNALLSAPQTRGETAAVLAVRGLQQMSAAWLQSVCSALTATVRKDDFVFTSEERPTAAEALEKWRKKRQDVAAFICTLWMLHFCVVKAVPTPVTAQSAIASSVGGLDATYTKQLIDYLILRDTELSCDAAAVAAFTAPSATADSSVGTNLPQPSNSLISCADLTIVADFFQRRSVSAVGASLARRYASSCLVSFSSFWSVTPVELLEAFLFVERQVSPLTLPTPDLLSGVFNISQSHGFVSSGLRCLDSIAAVENLLQTFGITTNAASPKMLTTTAGSYIFSSGAGNQKTSYGPSETVVTFKEKLKELLWEALGTGTSSSGLPDYIVHLNKEITSGGIFKSTGTTRHQFSSDPSSPEWMAQCSANERTSTQLLLVESFSKLIIDKPTWITLESVLLSLPDRSLLVLMLSRPLLFLLFFERYGGDGKYTHLIKQWQQLVRV